MQVRQIAGMRGHHMRDAGVEIMVDSSELGVVGLIEVLENIFKFIGILLKLRAEAARVRPDAVVLIDYPGFNIRFAKMLWKLGVPVVWYISPQVWAWRKSNIPKLAKYCSKMMVIFPFEPEVYAGSGLDAEFVGHPLIELVRGRVDKSIVRDPKRLLLLPGSRKSEISRLLEPMLRTVALLHARRPDLKYAIAAPRARVADDIARRIEEFKRRNPGIALPELDLRCGETDRWLQEAGTGFAASGTITVECAIAGLPLVVIYRLNPLTFLFARLVIRKLFRGFFTMVNIIANRRVFEEYLQHQLIPEELCAAVERALPDGSRRAELEAGMAEVVEALSCDSEGASARAARICLDVASRRPSA
jgi:lipid-A-disaccharide synthase